MLESTTRSISFSWELSGYDVRVSTGSEQTSSITSSDHNYNIFLSDGTVVPGFSVTIGVPLNGEVAVSFSADDIEHRAVPPLRKLSEGRPDFAQPEFVNSYISEPRYGTSGGIRTARLVIRPFFYDLQTGRLRVLRKGRGTVTFPVSKENPAPPAVSSAMERVLSRTLLNYDTARQWRRVRRRGLAKSAPKHPLHQQKAVRFRVGDGNGGINEGTTYENRLIKIQGADISSLDGIIMIKDVALYGAHKGELPEAANPDSTIPDGVTEIPLLRFDLDNNGRLDAEDYLIAYVSENSDWAPDLSDSSYAFKLNRYTDYRHYWVVVNPSAASTMDTLVTSGSGGTELTSFTDHLFYKSSKKLPVGFEGGLQRVWHTISGYDPYFTHELDLPHIVKSEPGYVRFNGYSPPAPQPSSRVTMEFDDGGDVVCGSCTPGRFYEVPAMGERVDDGRFRFKAEGAGSASYDISDFEVRYRRRLSMAGLTELTVFSPFDSGLVTYRLEDVQDTSLFIIRVPADESEMSLIQPEFAGTTCSWTDTAGLGFRYFVSYKSSVAPLPPATLHSRAVSSSFVIRDLRSNSYRDVNYLIVTDTVFEDQARSLAQHKRLYGTFMRKNQDESYMIPNPRIVYMHDIYRLFGGGNVDPAALRNFLAYAYRYWTDGIDPGLDYVVFMGNGHWDYKHAVSSEPLYIPTFQMGHRDNQKCIEDYFACLEPGESWNGSPDIILGRLPCDSPEEAEEIVNKIRYTEDPSLADFGAWRNRMLLVADDDMQGSRRDPIRDHHVSSERVGDSILNASPSVDMRKVYLFEYEWDEVYEKPEATRAIANEINAGVACVNYFGHGADILWADEHILAVDNMGILRNAPRYPLMCSFSCSVGKFDKPEHNALTDALVKFREAGAIGGIASTRLAYASVNTQLAKIFFNKFFARDTLRSVGEAYRESMRDYKSNKQYVLLGDPSIRLVNPVQGMTLKITDTSGTSLDTLQALQQIIVKGTIHPEGQSSVDKTYGTEADPAFAQIGIFNAPDTTQRKDGGKMDIEPYTLPGIPIFIGRVPVKNGRFEQRLRLPQRLSFDREGPKVTAYAWQGNQQALSHKYVTFHGSVQDTIRDSAAPSITVRPVYNDAVRNADATFGEKVVISLPIELEIGLFDENGIDVVGVGPDEGLTMEISDGVMSRRNINHKFRFAEGDFRTGSAVVSLENGSILPGVYKMTVGALDLVGNGGDKEFVLSVEDEQDFELGMVFNYPNPMKMGETTRFYFYTAAPTYPWQPDEVRAVIKIYTLSGKLVRVLETMSPDGIQNGIEWDGRDQLNQLLSPNIYLYQVTAQQRTSQLKTSKSEIKKLVIHPPR